MPYININNQHEIEIITDYKAILDEFDEKIKQEEKKYPLSEREKIFTKTIRDLLDKLDYSHRRW